MAIITNSGVYVLGTNATGTTALAQDILKNKTAVSAATGVSEVVTGSMPNNGALNYNLQVTGSTVTATIPQGYTTGGTIYVTQKTNNGELNYNLKATGSTVTATIPQGYTSGGTITVTQQNNNGTLNYSSSLSANGSYVASIPSGYTSGGTINITQSLPTKGAQTYTPSTFAQTISAGQYLSGDQTISAANLVQHTFKPHTFIDSDGSPVTIASGGSVTYSVDASDWVNFHPELIFRVIELTLYGRFASSSGYATDESRYVELHPGVSAEHLYKLLAAGTNAYKIVTFNISLSGTTLTATISAINTTYYLKYASATLKCASNISLI